jgi:tRNA A37 methylthiotransferase MiaB
MMPHQVTKDVSNQRTNQLTALSHHFQANYRQCLIDNQVVLRGVLETYKNGYSEAVSDHYLRLKVPEKLDIGKVVQITASEACL